MQQLDIAYCSTLENRQRGVYRFVITTEEYSPRIAKNSHYVDCDFGPSRISFWLNFVRKLWWWCVRAPKCGRWWISTGQFWGLYYGAKSFNASWRLRAIHTKDALCVLSKLEQHVVHDFSPLTGLVLHTNCRFAGNQFQSSIDLKFLRLSSLNRYVNKPAFQKYKHDRWCCFDDST